MFHAFELETGNCRVAQPGIHLTLQTCSSLSLDSARWRCRSLSLSQPCNSLPLGFPWMRYTCIVVEPAIPPGELHLASVCKSKFSLSDVLKLISSPALSVAGGSNSGTHWLLFCGFISHVECQTSAPGGAPRQPQNRSSESLILSRRINGADPLPVGRGRTNVRSVKEFYADFLDFLPSSGRGRTSLVGGFQYALCCSAHCFRLVAG